MDKHRQLFEQAVAAQEAGKLLLAGELFQKCLALDETFSNGWLRYASVLMCQKKWTEAINAVTHVLSDKSKNRRAIALSTMGQCYLKQELWSKAEVAFRKSLAIKPKSTTWVFHGFTLSELGRDDEAIESYKNALELQPEFDEAHYNLGCCFGLRREHEKAIFHFRRAIAADPKYARAYAELGWALAQDLSNNDNLNEACEVLEKSVELDRCYGWSRIYLAFVYEGFGEFNAAGEQYQTALKIWPDWELAHSLYGQLLANELNDRQGAKTHLKTAIALDPDYADALYHLGGNLLNWNKRIEGERYLRRAALLGHKKARKILDGLGPYVPKDDRNRSCSNCGAVLIQRAEWWCQECGFDRRAQKLPKQPK